MFASPRQSRARRNNIAVTASTVELAAPSRHGFRSRQSRKGGQPRTISPRGHKKLDAVQKVRQGGLECNARNHSWELGVRRRVFQVEK